MEMSEQINDLAAALVKAQAQIKPAVKDSTNPHFRSKYADLGAVWDACRAALTANGLSVVQMPTDAGEGRVGLTSMLMHTSGQWMRDTFSAPLQQNNAQGVGSALTYLRRYGLSALVGIVADEDDDGNAASAPRQQAQQQQRSATYQPVDTRTPIQPTNGARPAANSAANGDRITEPQMKKLWATWKDSGYEGDLREWVQTNYRCKVDELTRKQASEAIDVLTPESADVPA